MQVIISTSLSVFFGLAVDDVLAVSLHLPGFVPFFFVLTTREALWQLSLSPVGVNLSALAPWHLPLTFTGFSVVPAAVHALLEGLAQTFRANVQDPFAVVTPSVSHVGSQSVQGSMPPFVFAAGTPENPSRQSSIAARAGAGTTEATARTKRKKRQPTFEASRST